MEHLVPARLLVEELVKEGQLEVRRADVVGRDLAKLVEELGRIPSAPELEAWLEGHRMVSELYATTSRLEELLHRHFERPAAKAARAEEAAEAAPPALEARDPELEALLRESPDDVERYLVYSDWLQERADPLGELIALGVAAEGGDPSASARFERHLRAHEERFLGPLAGRLPPELTLRWRYGLVHGIEASWAVEAKRWRQLLELRVCEHLHRLRVSLRGSSGPALSDLLSALGARAARSVRVLALEDFYELSLPETLLRRRLAELTLSGSRLHLPASLPETIARLRLRVHELLLPDPPLRFELRELDTGLSAPVAELLPRVELPRLERLTLELRGCPTEALIRALEALQAPALVHLELGGRRLEAEAFAALARLPAARQLTSLALVGLELGDQAIQAIAEERDRFAALRQLDVSQNELTREGLEAARRLAPEVVSRRQERPGSGQQARLRRFASSTNSRGWVHPLELVDG
jgi:uncharacterized protein (TIGR02996 family)